MSASANRTQMVATANRLFTRQGFAGSTVRAVVAEAGTPWGSVSHYFPGGKEQLGEEAVQFGGHAISDLISESLASEPDVTSAVRTYFQTVASVLEQSGFEQGCPVATIALEVSSSDTSMSAVCESSMTKWTRLWERALVKHGVDEVTAGELGVLVIASVEGALLLSRVTRDLAPMRIVARSTVSAVENALRNAGRS